MTSDFKRRATVFGVGLGIGTLLSILLFQYAAYVEGPRETENVEVILTTCDLKVGQVFEESCVEKRIIAHQFTPPDVVMSDQVGLYVGRKVNVAMKAGDAIRTVDFEGAE